MFRHLRHAPAFPTCGKLHLKHAWDESPWKTKQKVSQRPLGKQEDHAQAQFVVLLLVNLFNREFLLEDADLFLTKLISVKVIFEKLLM